LHGKTKPLGIGTKVRLPSDHEFKQDWPDEYFVVGLNIDTKNSLNITISESLSAHGSVDGWGVQDFVVA